MYNTHLGLGQQGEAVGGVAAAAAATGRQQRVGGAQHVVQAITGCIADVCSGEGERGRMFMNRVPCTGYTAPWGEFQTHVAACKLGWV